MRFRPTFFGKFVRLFAIALSVVSGTERRIFAADLSSEPYFVIRVVDAETGRGVPLVELVTVNRIAHVTDSAGVIAFREPGLMDREVYFHVQSHGYDYPKDPLGNRGLKLTPRAGETAKVKIARRNIAERFYRVTGAGIYRDSVLAGLPVPLRAPVLNAEVLGQDTVIVTPYRGKLHWFWGDTDRASYPLGNFAAAGAISELPGRGGLAPGVGVDLTYFVNESGFAKAMCPDFGPGLHWIESVMTVPDERGIDRLVARVSSQKGLVTPHAWHLAVFNDEKQIFESKSRLSYPDVHDAAHPFRARVGGVDFLFLYPNYRVPAELASLADLARYEAYTCVAGDGKLREGAVAGIDRDSAGVPRYTWKRGADRLHEDRVKRLLAESGLRPDETWRPLRDVVTGARFTAGRGSVFWNEFRRRWVMIISSKPGEIWFAEADTPTGPWAYARRVVEHDNYNFYNPTQHPFFDEDGGRMIYFEGTYTESFSGAKTRTPRYDYNQIMYRLRLEDSRLNLPVAVYRVADGGKARLMLCDEIERTAAWARIEAVPFFAISQLRAAPGLVPVFEDASHRLSLESSPNAAPLFHALPAETAATHGITGRWVLSVRAQGGGDFSFEVEMAGPDKALVVTGTDTTLRGRGKFEAGRLTLEITLDGHVYELAAMLRKGELQGDWKRADRQESGTWTAQWRDPNPAEFRSSAVVPLYEYERSSDGRVTYATDPQASLDGFTRREKPLCRVWISPTTHVLFDRTPLEAGR